jgi:oxygen-independent coproporphyrinogen-3 oxidase
LERLLKVLSKYSASEYTFEANPGTVDSEKLKMMNYYGVNRISFGLQAYQDDLLKKLGRIHKFKDFLYSYDTARKTGFKNINIDLMFGIPDQTLSNWGETLEHIINLNPEHISCYSLIIEEGTPFYSMHERNELLLADEDTERDMYHNAIKILKSNGYKHYEISNFCRVGFECSHNITYWKDVQYIGVGAGSHSYVENRRYSSFKSIPDYITSIYENKPVSEESIISRYEEISEYMFLGLRMIEGIQYTDFQKRFKASIFDIYNEQINKLKNNNLLHVGSSGICLTQRGIDLSNQVFSEFILY